MHALPVTTLVLSFFYYWFGVADRYIVFLYYHEMGPLVPDTSPFSPVTSSRYWMAGLVAGGATMVLYAAAAWLLGRTVRSYRTPVWWRVWALCAMPLLVGIPAITMTINQPTLPPLNAAQATLTTLIGLALALTPGKLAAEHPGRLIWLAADGWALMLMLLFAPGLEEISRWAATGNMWRVRMMIGGFLAGAFGLLAITALRLWRRRWALSAGALFTAGLCVAYLLMPLVHHLIGTDGYYYISCASNFFASGGALQVLIWLIVGATAYSITQLREDLAARFPQPGQGDDETP